MYECVTVIFIVVCLSMFAAVFVVVVVFVVVSLTIGNWQLATNKYELILSRLYIKTHFLAYKVFDLAADGMTQFIVKQTPEALIMSR